MRTAGVTSAKLVAGIAYFIGLGLGDGEALGEGDGLGPGATLSSSTAKTSVAFGGMITAPVWGSVCPFSL